MRKKTAKKSFFHYLSTMYQYTLIAILIPVVILAAYNNRKKYSMSNGQSATRDSTLVIKTNDGWHDFVLKITNTHETGEAVIFTAMATHNSSQVGFAVTLPKGKLTKQGMGKGLILKRTGPESDRLIELMAYLYKVEHPGLLPFRESVSVEYVNLEVFAAFNSVVALPADLTTGKHKLFFNTDSDGEYAELYLNIDRQQGTIEIAEKDEEYRPLVIAALSH